MEQHGHDDNSSKPTPPSVSELAQKNLQLDYQLASGFGDGLQPSNGHDTTKTVTPDSAPHAQSPHSEAPATASPENSPTSAKPAESQQTAARPATTNVERPTGVSTAPPESGPQAARPSTGAESAASHSPNPFIQTSQSPGPSAPEQRSVAPRSDTPPPANAIGSPAHRETLSESTVAYKTQPASAETSLPRSTPQQTPERSTNNALREMATPKLPNREGLNATLGDRPIQPVIASPPGEPRVSWYDKRAAAETSNQVQKTPGATATATLEGNPQSKGAPLGPNPFINGPDHAEPPAARQADKTNSTRNPLDGVNDHLIADGKGGASKVNSWLDEPEHSTRKPDVGQPGQIAYGGVTPDGREHPFGLAGRVLEPKGDSVKGQTPTGNIPETGGKGPTGGRPEVGLIPQLLDGQGGWKPNIKLPFGEKGQKGETDTKEPGDHAGEDSKGGRKQSIAEFVAEKIRKQTNGDAIAGDGKPTRRAADGSILDATIMDSKVGKPTRRGADGSPLDATMMDAKETRPPRRTAEGALLDATMHENDASTRKQSQTNVAEAFIGIIESVKGGLITGAKLPLRDGQAATVKTDATAKDNAQLPGELILTGVKTKMASQSADGTLTNTVAVLTPFLTGGGLRISKTPGSSGVEFGQPHDQTIANTAIKSAAAAITLSTASGDSLPLSLVNAKGEEEFAARILEEGRLKSRPSVNLHVPGGKFVGKGDGQDGGEIDIHGKDQPGANKPKPYLTFGGGTSYADQNLTVEDMSIPPLPLAEFELAHAAAEAAGERVKPTKAIDELEVTDQMSAKVREEVQKRVRDDRYLYIVQDGDTIESIAATVLKAPQLAPLLFSLNRKYVLPEIMYGVHPLMVGVVLQLPTPSDILKFGQ